MSQPSCEVVDLRTIILSLAAIALVQIDQSSNIVFAEIFIANLSGTNEVPPVSTDGLGYALINTGANNTAIKYEVNVTRLSNATGANLQLESSGQNGPVIVDLFKGGETNQTELGMVIKGNITDLSLIGPALGKGLTYLNSAIRSGDTYVNIRTHDHPDGEIRGQVGSGHN